MKTIWTIWTIWMILVCVSVATAQGPVPASGIAPKGSVLSTQPERYPIPEEFKTLFNGLMAQASAIQKAEDTLRTQICATKSIPIADCDVAWIQGAQAGTFGKRMVPPSIPSAPGPQAPAAAPTAPMAPATPATKPPQAPAQTPTTETKKP